MSAATIIPDCHSHGTTGIAQLPPPAYLHKRVFDRGFNVVRWILGLLLITTAVMKLASGSGEILRVALPFISPSIYVLIAVTEALLGLWLITGWTKTWSWLFSVVLFSLMGAVSFRLAWLGRTSCGCLGKFTLSPWIALTIDVFVVIALMCMRPKDFKKGIAKEAEFIALPVITTALVVAMLVWRYGSFSNAIGRLRGNSVTIASDFVDFGTGVPGEWLKAKIKVHNWADQSVRLIGGTSDCTCWIDSTLPALIPPARTIEITLMMRVPHSGPGSFARNVEIWSDSPNTRTIVVRAGCHIESDLPHRSK